MDENYSQEHYDRAKKLLFEAKVYALTLITPLEELVPKFKEIRYSNLFEMWDYYISLSYVGVAFMLLADSFTEKESDSMANAIKQALIDWEYNPYNYNNYEITLNFLDTVNSIVKNGLPYDIAIGSWIMIRLRGSKKASPQLKELTESSSSAQLIGSSIIRVALNHWKED